MHRPIFIIETDSQGDWTHPSYKLAVVDLLANIVFAVDRISEMVRTEADAEPFDGFYDALVNIHVNASGALEALGVEELRTRSRVAERP